VPSQKGQRPKFIFKARGFTLALGGATRIMGIINVTPDSFSRDGLLNKGVKAVLERAKRMVEEGADILDIGGESTRPGAKPVSAREECRRVIPVIKLLQSHVRVPLSIDTRKPIVARSALEAGASIVNDIAGLQPDRSLLKAVKDFEAGIVLMHMKGAPQTMQRRPRYRDVVAEIIAGLRKSVGICLECSIKSDRIILDPGIGFGKTLEHNLTILRDLESFKILKKPLLLGTSRKSFIGKILDNDVDQRLMGTAASVCAAVAHGAHIVRVHDVAPMREAIKISDAIFYGIQI
jgi:dihydropteroate synthase